MGSAGTAAPRTDAIGDHPTGDHAMNSAVLVVAVLVVLAIIIIAALRWRRGAMAVADITLACGQSERFTAPHAGTFVIKINRVCTKATVDVLVQQTGKTHRLKIKDGTGEPIDLELEAGGVVSVEVQRGDTIIMNCAAGTGACEFTLYDPFSMRHNERLFSGVSAAACAQWTSVDLWVYAATRVTIRWSSVCSDARGVEQTPEVRGVTAGTSDSATQTPTPGPSKVAGKFTWQGTLEPGGATGGGAGGGPAGTPFTRARRLEIRCPGTRGGPCQADISLSRP